MQRTPTHTVKSTGEKMVYVNSKHRVTATMLVEQIRVDIDCCRNEDEVIAELNAMTATKVSNQVETSLYVSGSSYFDCIDDKLAKFYDHDFEAMLWAKANERARQLFPKFF